MKKKQWPDLVMIERHGYSYAQLMREQAERSGVLRFDLGMLEHEAPLVERGRLQAAARGRWLRQLPAHRQPTVVLVSPFVRTCETNEIQLAEWGIPLTQLTVKVDERLREFEHGDLTYLTRRGRRELHPEEEEKERLAGLLDYAQAVGQSIRSKAQDMLSLRDDLQGLYAGERVLLVSHSRATQCGLAGLLNLTDEQFELLIRSGDVANCSITTLVPCSECDVLVPDPEQPYLGDPLSAAAKARDWFAFWNPGCFCVKQPKA